MHTTAPPTVIHTQPLINPETAGLLKFVSVLATLALLIVLALLEKNFLTTPRSHSPNLKTLATIPYTSVLYPDIGVVLTPHTTLPVTIQNREHSITFTLDSGAVISAIPLSYAEKYQVETAGLKRIILKSLSDDPVFAYMTEATLSLPDTDIPVPLAFAEVSQAVLGRHGFFNDYTLIFDNTNKTITIGTANQI